MVRPSKTHVPLLVDGNAELASPFAAQRREAVAGQHHPVASPDRRLRNIEVRCASSLDA
jgi:hypothetical protein